MLTNDTCNPWTSRSQRPWRPAHCSRGWSRAETSRARSPKKSRIVDLSRFWKGIGYGGWLVKGSGDELFAYSDCWSPVLRYHDGAFDALPLLERPIRTIF